MILRMQGVLMGDGWVDDDRRAVDWTGLMVTLKAAMSEGRVTKSDASRRREEVMTRL